MRMRVLAVVAAAGLGLTAGNACSGDYSAGYGRVAPPAPAPAPVAAPADDSCGSVAAAFGQIGDSLGLGGAGDDMPWQLADRPDDGVTAFLDRLKAENGRIDRIQAAYDAVTECRKAEVRTLKADVAAARLPRAAAEARLAAIHRLYETDVLMARLIGQIVTLRADRLREAARRPAAAPHLPKKLRDDIAEQTATNQAKRSAFVASITRAEQWRDTGFVLG